MTHPTAEQILTVLHDGKPVDFTTLEFCVITGIHRSSQRDTYWPFAQGEMIVVSESGREPFGEGRKPGKWDVIEHTTTDYEQARALSELAKPGARRGLWEWTGGEWRYCTGCGMERRWEPNVAWLGDMPDREEGWQQ